MLVFCAGMRRAGSTAIFNVVKELVEVTKTGHALRLPQHDHVTISGYFDSDKYIVVKAHALKDYFEEKIHKAKVLMTVRDVREIACSLIRLRKIRFEDIMEFKVLDGYIKEQQTWNCATNVYFRKYEDWVDDLLTETQNIADYLGLIINEFTTLDIAAKWSIEANTKRASETAGTNHITFLNPDHITSGNPNTMHEHLTQEQIDIITEKYRWWLEKYDYPC